MREQLKHHKAFNYYYSLGDRRSLPLVARRFTVSVTAVKKWSQRFKWQEHVVRRDGRIARRLRKRTDSHIVNTITDYRKAINDAFCIVKAVLKAVVGEDYKISINLKDVDDLRKAGDMLRELIKLDLLLMGEDNREKAKNSSSEEPSPPLDQKRIDEMRRFLEETRDENSIRR